MVQIIETNLSLDYENNIKDHQTRVIEVKSWEDYVNEIKETKTINRNSVIGSLHGTTIPLHAKVENITYDDFHLSCDIYNYLGFKTKKLCYKV